MPSTYKIVITATNAGGAAPADGFIDRKTVEQYMAEGSTVSSLANSRAKERGNIRFDFIQQQLQLEANIYITAAVATDATSNLAGTDFQLTVEAERGDSVLWTRDENTPGAALTGTAALKRMVARALMESRTTAGDVYDPTAGTAPGNSTSVARRGIRLEQLVVGPLATGGTLAQKLTAAEALVTSVTKIV